MGRPFLRSGDVIARIFDAYGGTLYRVCYSFLRHPADAEDAVQETFLRLIRSGPEFESDEHLRNWLIRVAVNVCKNVLKSTWRKNEALDDHPEPAAPEENGAGEILSAVLDLPEKYRIPVLLYYYEGYKGDEIAAMLGASPSTVRNRLRKAREILRERLGDDHG